MKSAFDHYEEHLSHVYSWMAGDYQMKTHDFLDFLKENKILPHGSGIALDLGSGHGIQSFGLSELGFHVKAVDFNANLIKELENNCPKVETFVDDLLNVEKFSTPAPVLILCWGDTLTHLDSFEEVEIFLSDCSRCVASGGLLVLSFRNYTFELCGDNRFIPVKSDENRIMTCFLEYVDKNYLSVTDIVYEKSEKGWQQSVSSYKKLRLAPCDIEGLLHSNNMKLLLSKPINGFHTIIAQKE